MMTDYLHQDDQKMHEECGVFAISNNANAFHLTCLGMHSLQHRGQESSGVVVYDVHKQSLLQVKEHGLVSHLISANSDNADLHTLDNSNVKNAIGHVRYSTSGDKLHTSIQPFVTQIANASGFTTFALAHNGNLTNADEIRIDLVKQGVVFTTNIDTEVFVHLIARSKKDSIKEKIRDAASQVKGAYSVVAMNGCDVIGFRDKNGIRPLVLGELFDKSTERKSYVLASETCALDIIGAKFVRDIAAGEIVIIDTNGSLESDMLFAPGEIDRKFCVFEYIYFARPDSLLENNYVYNLRKEFGKSLAEFYNVDADVVIPVPDSGVPAALGFSEKSGIPFDLGLIRSHYTGRSFIDPTQQLRDLKVLMKHNVNRSIVDGKRIILIDDSIVRGTTSKKIVNMLFTAGAKEVHMRISSPQTKYSCFYGIDTPNKEKLLSNICGGKVDQIRDYLGLTSLAYLTLEQVYSCIKTHKSSQFCDACFSGNLL